MTRLLLLLGIVALVAGCDTSGSSPVYETRRGKTREYAVTAGEANEARVDINGTSVSGDSNSLNGREVSSEPVVVQAGVPFDVTVYTFSNPCHRAAPSEVAVSGRTATVAVFDDVALGACYMMLTYTPRTDSIVIETPGAGEVVVRGMTVDVQTGDHPDHTLRFPVVVE